jgi:hypothetical protein
MDIIDQYRELMAPVTKITEDVINGLMTEDEGQALVDNLITRLPTVLKKTATNLSPSGTTSAAWFTVQLKETL